MDKFIITSNEADQRVDRFLRKYLKNTPLSEIYKLLRKKSIKVNGRKADAAYRLRAGDTVEINHNIDGSETAAIKKAGRDFEVVYEDDNILIVNKPPELIIHPDLKHKENTLVDQVIYYLYQKNEYNPEKERTFRPAPANRLDLNTGGIVLFAKNYPSLQSLSSMVKERDIQKLYIAVVKGDKFTGMEKVSYLLKDERNNKVSILNKKTEGSREIRTAFKVLRYGGGYTLVEIDLITGRSHQIRAQLASLGYPIVGDMKYGDNSVNRIFKNKYNLNSQFLWGYKVSFKDHGDNLSYLKGRVFTSELPRAYKNILQDIFNYGV